MSAGDRRRFEDDVSVAPPAGLERFAAGLREQLIAAAERQIAPDDRCARTGRPLRSR